MPKKLTITPQVGREEKRKWEKAERKYTAVTRFSFHSLIHRDNKCSTETVNETQRPHMWH